MTKEAMLFLLGQLMTGLAVARSIDEGSALGAARDPWDNLHKALVGLGWHTAEEYTVALTKTFECD